MEKFNIDSEEWKSKIIFDLASEYKSRVENKSPLAEDSLRKLKEIFLKCEPCINQMESENDEKTRT